MARVYPPRLIAYATKGAKLIPGELPHGDPDPADEETCDRCAAAALLLLERDAATLALCGHHYDAYWITLYASGWEVTRDRRTYLQASS